MRSPHAPFRLASIRRAATPVRRHCRRISALLVVTLLAVVAGPASRPAAAESALACDIASDPNVMAVAKIFGLPHSVFITRKLANPDESACEMSAWADGAPPEQPLPMPVTASGILPNWMRYSVPAGRSYAGFWTGHGLP